MNNARFTLCIQTVMNYESKTLIGYKKAIMLAAEFGLLIHDLTTAKLNVVQHKKTKINSFLQNELGYSEQDAEKLLQEIIKAEKDNVDFDNSKTLEKVLQMSFNQENLEYQSSKSKTLMSLFENPLDALKYLSRYLSNNENAIRPIHDACQIEIPDDPEQKWTPSIWKEILFANMKNPPSFQLVLNLLKSAPLIEESYHADNHENKSKLEKMTLNEISNYRVTYPRENENPEAAKLFFNHGLDEESFNLYLSLVPADNSKLIPDIKVNLPDNEFTLKKLPSTDPRAAILGALTGCCQSIGSDAEECVIYGITKENAGFYTITNKKNQIVSQFFGWRQGEHFVIDSLESSDVIFSATKNKGKDINLIDQFAVDIMATDPTIKMVHIGTGGRTPDNMGLKPFIKDDSLCPPDFDAYRDSKYVRTLRVADKELFTRLRLENDNPTWTDAAAAVKTSMEFNYVLSHCPHAKINDVIDTLLINHDLFDESSVRYLNRFPIETRYKLLKAFDYHPHNLIEFINILSILPKEDHLNYVQNTSYDNFKLHDSDTVRQAIKMLSDEGKLRFCEIVISWEPHMMDIIMNELPAHQQNVLAINLANLIKNDDEPKHNVTSFSHVLKWLAINKNLEFLKDNDLIRTGEDVSLIISTLEVKERYIFASEHKDKLRSGNDLRGVMESLSPDEAYSIALSSNNAFNSAVDVRVILELIPAEKRLEFVNRHQDIVAAHRTLAIQFLNYMPDDHKDEYFKQYITDELLTESAVKKYLLSGNFKDQILIDKLDKLTLHERNRLLNKLKPLWENSADHVELKQYATSKINSADVDMKSKTVLSKSSATFFNAAKENDPISDDFKSKLRRKL